MISDKEIIVRIAQAIEHLGLEVVALKVSDVLGSAGIGLDSQELVELTCFIEKDFNIKLPSQFLSKSSTVNTLLTAIKERKSSEAREAVFEGKCEASIIMEVSPDKAYQAIFEMEKWPENLPHVEKIETLYNDDRYQEFLMDVKSDTGLIKVRSIRRCTHNDTILFFQPTPPIFLKHHCGGWSFEPHKDGCLVKTWHEWNLDHPKAGQKFPEKDGETYQEQVQEMLLDHAKLALSTWKQNLEPVYEKC